MAESTPEISHASLKARIGILRSQLAACAAAYGRQLSELRIIAVTKSVGPEVLPTLAAEGLFDCGENRVEHLEEMTPGAPEGMRFHAIGRVQSRQLAYIAQTCVTLHSLHNPEHIPRLAEICRQTGRRIEVFCQVNTSGEASKAGISPDDLPAMLDLLFSHADALQPVGLMTMAPELTQPGVTADTVRKCFSTLRDLAEDNGLQRLSMGMSGDWRLAVAEGATDLRLGSVLFPK